MEISELEFGLLRKYLHSKSGIDVPWEKKYLFETRLDELLQELSVRSFAELYRKLTLSGLSDIHGRLVEAMTTNETGFFRDRHPFEALEKGILPAVAKERLCHDVGVSRRIRVASIGCSTGEEPYSIAIIMREWLRRNLDFDESNVAILAVDISRVALEQAKRGKYKKERIEGVVSWHYINEYFEHDGEMYCVNQNVKKLVSFAEVNLNNGLEHLGYFDVIFCRNVMIYFAPDLKLRLIGMFHRMLNYQGVLVLGASESLLTVSDDFKIAHHGATSYYIKNS